MRNLPGILMLAGAAWLVWSALGRRRRAQDAAARGEAPPALHPSLEMMGGIMPPLVNLGLVIAGSQVAFAFWLTSGAGIFGPLDLIGFLALLAAYGHWLGTKARHRLPA
ncbi:hypothetical protein [Belnapia sp. F-4-1]|uniref:hypothetical protein n=1 Tax=Belnapia sp. F-4-1 TaxID=1545443 RepID=UPI0005B97289|nr:hypothetical protein [Belnapia sp. F-4-1]